jgi:hypothetical protein
VAIHNRYLPGWAHRLANGIVAAAVLVSIAVIGLTFVDASGNLANLCWWLLKVAAPVGFLMLFVSPERFSLVRGIGGEVGYDELAKPKRPEA